jgi:D-amino-acid dehydrogenase
MHMHVCVLGAGIAGLASAYMLRQAGHEVTLVDAQKDVAAGASAGNGGQLSYAYVQPLADPSIWRQLPKLLLAPDSPLKIRPKLDPAQWRWGVQFLRACTRARSQGGTARLLALAAASREAFDAMRLAERIDADFRENGKLVLYRDAQAFASARSQMDLQRRLGGPAQEALSPAEVRAMEPSLGDAARHLAGAIYTPHECVADCHALCVRLADLLRSRGARLLLGGRVMGFNVRAGRVVSLRTAQEEIAADAFVLAAGAGSAGLARSVGVKLPVYPLKGYSLTLDIAAPERVPRASITDAGRKIVFARIGSRLRVAGMAELIGNDLAIPPGRIAALASATQDLFPGACDWTDSRPWAGLRPATPDGVPIVGRVQGAPSNLLFNTGHGALGFTLAFGTAAQLVRQLAPPRFGPAVPAAPAARPA